MSNRKTPGTTLWVRPTTLKEIHQRKRIDETVDEYIRRLLGGRR